MNSIHADAAALYRKTLNGRTPQACKVVLHGMYLRAMDSGVERRRITVIRRALDLARAALRSAERATEWSGEDDTDRSDIEDAEWDRALAAQCYHR